MTGQAMGLRERKRYETHRTLATTALKLVAERGLDHVTVEGISSAAGVSSRTFFNYFATKEDAVVIAYPDPAAQADRTAEALVAAPADLDPVRAFVVALRDDLERIEADKDEWLTRMSVIEANPDLVSRMIISQGDSERRMIGALAERTGLKADEFYPALVFAVVGGALQAAIRRWYRLGGRQPLVELVETAVDAVARGLPHPGKHSRRH